MTKREKNKNKYDLVEELKAKLPFKFSKHVNQPTTIEPTHDHDPFDTNVPKVTEIILDDLQDQSSDNDSEISWNIPSL